MFSSLVYVVARVHTSYLFTDPCMDRPHPVSLLTDVGHLGCFHLLALRNNAAMNIPMKFFVWIYVFSFGRFIPKSRIAG